MSPARGAAYAAAFLMLASVAAPAAADDGRLERLRSRALSLVNEDRRERDLRPLEFGAALNDAAQSHADDMAERGYYSHRSPEGATVMDRFVEAGGGRWRLVAENIARCESCQAPTAAAEIERLHRGWMNSPHHRENILNPGLSRFGFGVSVDRQSGLYAVQTFAGPGGASAGEETELPPTQRTPRAVELVNEMRRDAGAPPLEASPALAIVARSLLPASPDQGLSLQRDGDLLGALPPAERPEWGRVAVIAGECGGCGMQPTAADIRSFRERWAENPRYREMLSDPGFSHLGLAMASDGAGRKLAVAVLGERR